MSGSEKIKALEKTLITVTGIVIPAKWDHNENAIAVSIATFQEREYLVDTTNKAGKELCNFLHQKIKVSGFLGPAVPQKRSITVKTYELLENNESAVLEGIDQIDFQKDSKMV
jgi:hypothetical protein